MLKKRVVLFLVLIIGMVAFSNAINSSLNETFINETSDELILNLSADLNISFNDTLELNNINLTNDTDSIEIESYYVEIGKDNQLSSPDIIFDEIEFRELELGNYVIWEQNIQVWNRNLEAVDETVNLLDFPDLGDFLDESSFILIYENGNIISDTFAFIAQVDVNSTKNYTVEFYTPAIESYVICKEESLADLIPVDATILNTNTDLNALVSKVCEVRLEFDTELDYSDIKINLDDLVDEDISRIYSVDQNKYIDFDEGFEVS